jgi:hypothetical protein
VFLITVLAIGVVVLEMAMSLIVLGIAAQQSGQTVMQSAQAYELAHTCAERGILSLRADLSYDGDESVSTPQGICQIFATAGSGNMNRGLCVEGQSGRSTRRMEVFVRQVYPMVKVVFWREVSSFTICP